MKNTHNTLDRINRVRLTAWLADKETLVKEKTDSDIAELATKALGFEISSANVKSIRSILFPNAERNNMGNPIFSKMAIVERELREIITRNETTISNLEARLELVEEALQEHLKAVRERLAAA